MDDLLALFDEGPLTVNGDTSEEKQDQFSSHDHTNDKRSTKCPDSLDTNSSAAEKCALSVDDRVGIRMINRKLSGAEMMNLITDSPYHSIFNLGGYSLSVLNRLLEDPSTQPNAATVFGKVNLVTVGIVYSNSGTRIASSGNSFCVLQLGNFSTKGRTDIELAPLSVLLFGTNYSQHVRTCIPGKVVAIVNPRLMPPKPGAKDTTRTFVVNDDHQLILMGDARDFGRCKAKERGKNETGSWVNNAKCCGKPIDTRIGSYCTKHRRQQNPTNKTSIRKGSTITAMEQLRNQATAFPARRHPNSMRKMTFGKESEQLKVRTNVENVPSITNLKIEPTKHLQTKSISNSLLNPRQHKSFRKYSIPHGESDQRLHQIATSHGSSNTKISNQQQQQACQNPYTGITGNTFRGTCRKKDSSRNTLLTPTNTTTKQSIDSKSRIVTKDILLPSKKSKVSHLRAINTDTEGFNGSVPVPAPSKIFARASTSSATTSWKGSIGSHHRSVIPAPVEVNLIRGKQQLIATQLLKEKAKVVVDSHTSRSKKSSTHCTKPTSSGKIVKSKREEAEEMLFSVLGRDFDFEKVRGTTESYFAEEANAEEYARSRRIVTELEKEEAKKILSSKTKASQEKHPLPIEKEWRCWNCKQTFARDPVSCRRRNHTVKVLRSIRTIESKADTRHDLSSKEINDGGLKLGSGLDWSYRNYSSS